MAGHDTASRHAVLVTGGAGYIGAHTCKALYERGYLPVIFDDLSSGFSDAVRWGVFVQGDVRDASALCRAIDEHRIRTVIHFAGLIEVGRSVARPDVFWDVNVGGAIALLSAMRDRGIQRLVFSSSAAVYGHVGRSPLGAIQEDAPKAPTSPYGDTKLACERMIEAECHAYGLSAVALRYFNAAGADPSGVIGEAHEPETHLVPLAIAAGLGRSGPLTIFGDDFDTPDGSCLRDYIHVSDLAQAHVAAVNAKLDPSTFLAVNVGTGRGRSVLEVVAAVGRVVGRPVPYVLGSRRAGDPSSLVADPRLAREILGWSAECSDLGRIVADALRWETNPAYGIGARLRRRTVADAAIG